MRTDAGRNSAEGERAVGRTLHSHPVLGADGSNVIGEV